MKSLQRKSQVHTCFLVIVVDALVWIQAATAQLSISTLTDGVQCFGDPASLVCTHPVLPQVPKYMHADVSWRRDGTAISTTGLANKTNSTTTYLHFTITEDTVGNYTCFLSNNVRGGIVESNSVSVQPLGLDPTLQSNSQTTPLQVYLPIAIILIIVVTSVTGIMMVCWLRRNRDQGPKNALSLVALFQKISCCYKEKVIIDNNEYLMINYSSNLPVPATQSSTTEQGNDPMRSADSNVHFRGNSHQLVFEVPLPLPQEIQQSLCVGYSHIRIPGYNSFGMDSNNTADCVSIGLSHNGAKGSDFVPSTVKECSMTEFVAQFLNCLLPNFKMPDELEYTWNI